MRRALAFTAALGIAALPAVVDARAIARLDGGTLFFFADTLAIVARDGATLQLDDGTQAHADAAFVDLKTDRVLLAGHASVTRRTEVANADAIALDLDSPRVDLLDTATGASTTTRALATPTAAPIDASRFAFPEVDERSAYIRAKHAAITPRTGVRFSPAAFPTSVGAVPVPSYLYTFATSAGFGATSLSGATFDQPYGLFGTPNSLTALHARWIDGTGAALALQHQIVSGDDAYVAGSIDAPFRGNPVRALNAYTRVGSHATASLNATGTTYGWSSSGSVTTALLHGTIARVDLGLASGGYSSSTLSLRTPDRPLFFGLTWSVLTSFGFDAQRGGLLVQLPDARDYSMVWRHAIDGSIATPVVRGPLRTQIGATFDATRTWYSFPHHRDDLVTNITASRAFSRKLTVFAGYTADWSSDVYPTAQALFYPGTLLPAFAPDGTPWPDRNAYSGAGMTRAESLAIQLTPEPTTSLRFQLTHHQDFPQFHGWGFPQWELRGDARFRPFPNFGIDVGRAYDFAWGGTRWVPRWTFAITP